METQSVAPPEQFVIARIPLQALVAPTLQAAQRCPLARTMSGVSQPGYRLVPTPDEEELEDGVPSVPESPSTTDPVRPVSAVFREYPCRARKPIVARMARIAMTTISSARVNQ